MQNNAQLNWDMAQQDGIDSYDIEWSADGLHFKTLTSISANSSQLKYQYIHNNIEAINYYRIKFRETTGKVEYSSIRCIKDGSRKNVDIFPNPFVENITVRALEIGDQINVYNASGSVLFQKNATSSIENINTEKYPKGIYFVKIFSKNGTAYSQKIVK